MRRHSTYERVWLLILIGAGIFAAGMIARAVFFGNFEVTAEIEIAGDAERVWPYITTPDFRTRWQPGITDIMSVEASDIERPKRFLLFYHIAGKSFEVSEIIVERREPSLWRADREAETYSETVSYNIVRRSDGRVRIVLQKARTYRNFRDRLAAPFTGFFEVGRMERSLSRLEFLLDRAAVSS